MESPSSRAAAAPSHDAAPAPCEATPGPCDVTSAQRSAPTGPPPQLSAEELRHLAERSPSWWREACGPVQVTPLGRGESYHAWLVRRGASGGATAADAGIGRDTRARTGTGEGSVEELVVRVPHKALAELPLPPSAELDILRRVPAGLGARGVAAREPSAEDPWALVVTTRVPGRMLPAAAWTRTALLVEHSRALARLHERGDRRGMPAPAAPDPVGAAEAAAAWWREHEPRAARSLEPLLPGALRYLEERAPAFEHADAVLLHGDPAAANVLVTGVDESGEATGGPIEVRFVDWEWSQVGDGARDLAFIGGPLHAEPWYAPLGPDQVRAHAQAYVRERERWGTRIELGPLLRRREAHLLHECLFTSAHLWRVAQADGAVPGGDGTGGIAVDERLTDRGKDDGDAEAGSDHDTGPRTADAERTAAAERKATAGQRAATAARTAASLQAQIADLVGTT